MGTRSLLMLCQSMVHSILSYFMSLHHYTPPRGYLHVCINTIAGVTARTVTCELAHLAQRACPPCTEAPSQLLVSLRKGIGVGVMDERVVAVAPREGLISDAEVAVWVELWLSVLLNMFRVFFLLGVGVVSHKEASWDSNEQRNSFPNGKGAQSVAFLLFYSLFKG